jgi:hypothetical protein
MHAHDGSVLLFGTEMQTQTSELSACLFAGKWSRGLALLLDAHVGTCARNVPDVLMLPCRISVAVCRQVELQAACSPDSSVHMLTLCHCWREHHAHMFVVCCD